VVVKVSQSKSTNGVRFERSCALNLPAATGRVAIGFFADQAPIPSSKIRCPLSTRTVRCVYRFAIPFSWKFFLDVYWFVELRGF
jgi:hypothetical protein